jgi:hypothetical protein
VRRRKAKFPPEHLILQDSPCTAVSFFQYLQLGKRASCLYGTKDKAWEFREKTRGSLSIDKLRHFKVLAFLYFILHVHKRAWKCCRQSGASTMIGDVKSSIFWIFFTKRYIIFFLKTYGIISLTFAAFFDFVALQTFCQIWRRTQSWEKGIYQGPVFPNIWSYYMAGRSG